MGNSKNYDAFISYAHEDHHWVGQDLVHQLEVEYGFKCCFHERDFQIGVTVIQNIVNCVDSSKVFIVVLSPHYVNSTWCMFELFLAQSRMKGTANLIVIVKQKIQQSKADKRVQMTLKLWTYLQWNETNPKSFWNKLANTIKSIISGNYEIKL